ncbi:MAG: 3-isopropylmalate dehydratase large subunit [Thermodesulfobacteriota bacterium]|nr:3-isopropylmalate dehydratase large subunit [Thermodesulfobacteriota bacterium]
MGMTFAEKIISLKSGNKSLKPGDMVDISPDWIMTHDNTWDVIDKFNEIGIQRVWDPEKIVILLGNFTPSPNEQYARNNQVIREFVKKFKIKHFYDHLGVCHQIFCEQGHALPDTIILGCDSHTTTYGGLGAFSTGISRTESAAIFVTGKTWLRVPETIRIEMIGEFAPGVMTKDFILHLIGTMDEEETLYRAIEFTGPTVQNMTLDSKLTLANMSVDLGAKIGYIAPDEKTICWIKERAKRPFEVVLPDKDATYWKTMTYDVNCLEPQVACPHDLRNLKPVREVAGKRIDQAIIGTCTNGRLEDLEIAARVVKGRKSDPNVRFLIFPASKEIYLEALKKHIIQDLAEAGAIIMNPNCGPCLGSHGGIIGAGEVCIASQNRNFRGRMGSRDSEIYVASPATVAASALRGQIADCREFLSF